MFRRFLTLSVVALVATACTSGPTCTADSGPPCECAPGDVRMCTTDAGLSGLQYCLDQGTWAACAEYSEASAETTPPEDVPPFDAGGIE